MAAMTPGCVQTDMGGAGAILRVDDSVRAKRGAIAGLAAKHKGQFLSQDEQELGGSLEPHCSMACLWHCWRMVEVVSPA